MGSSSVGNCLHGALGSVQGGLANTVQASAKGLPGELSISSTANNHIHGYVCINSETNHNELLAPGSTASVDAAKGSLKEVPVRTCNWE
jgi:hypothetical protein